MQFRQSIRIQKSTVIQTNLGGFFNCSLLLAQNNHVPQNQTSGFQISFLVLSDKVSEFRQTVRQVLSGIMIQTIALPALKLRKHGNLVSPFIARGWGDCNHIVFQALKSRDASGVADRVSLRCATPLERHQQQSSPSPQIADHKIIFLCSPQAKTDGGRAACKERSRTQQISAQDATTLPPSHFACNAAPTIVLPSPQIADHKIIFLYSPPAKSDGGRAACKERSRMQQISEQDATMLPPSHFACNAGAAPAIHQSYRPVTISQTSQSLYSRLV